MTTTLAQTPMHDWHVAANGRMVDFAGWSMPVQYSSIVEEHNATRTATGVFDVSHMGRLQFKGEGAAKFLDRLVTRRVADMKPGRIRYSLVTNEQGGILDDVLVYRLQKEDGTDFFAMVVNASNREKIVAWIESHLEGSDVQLEDHTAQSAMIAVQGPLALEIVQPIIDVSVSDLGYYTGVVTKINGTKGVVSRTGYTGEDGCELIVPAEAADSLWRCVMEAGSDRGIKAAGLGARDTLRLEAAMPLYGHELSESIDPFKAGLGFAVNLKDRDFIGRAALVEAKNATDQQKRIGLELSGRRIPREGFKIQSDGEDVGEVTSGTFSPTLERPIAMGYVRASVADVDTELQVDIRGRSEAARVVELPFYRRPS